MRRDFETDEYFGIGVEGTTREHKASRELVECPRSSGGGGGERKGEIRIDSQAMITWLGKTAISFPVTDN